MATFTFEAIDPVGRTIKGKLPAESESLALQKLHEQNFHVLSVTEQKGAAVTSFGNKSAGAPKLQSVVIFSRQFATMIDAGIPVMKCLDLLEQQIKDIPLQAAINAVRKDVKGGSSLGDALGKHPNCFTKLYVNMIRAAEIGGILDSILDRLAGFLENEMEIKNKIKSAMTYPILVLGFALIVVVALFYYVLPTFRAVFADIGVELPALTVALFTFSDALVRFWYVPPIAGVIIFFAVKSYGNTVEGRKQIDMLKLRVPIIGDLVLKMAISRFTRTFGTLISAGVPMMRAMEIIGETAGNVIIAGAINDSRNAIREGQRLSLPLTQSGLFPPMVTHMIDVGEETGRLSEMLVKVSEFYDKEVENGVKSLTSMIEPLLIVFLGVLVGFIVIAILGPLFKLVSSINK